jgi:hypothetical protein
LSPWWTSARTLALKTLAQFGTEVTVVYWRIEFGARYRKRVGPRNCTPNTPKSLEVMTHALAAPLSTIDRHGRMETECRDSSLGPMSSDVPEAPPYLVGSMSSIDSRHCDEARSRRSQSTEGTRSVASDNCSNDTVTLSNAVHCSSATAEAANSSFEREVATSAAENRNDMDAVLHNIESKRSALQSPTDRAGAQGSSSSEKEPSRDNGPCYKDQVRAVIEPPPSIPSSSPPPSHATCRSNSPVTRNSNSHNSTDAATTAAPFSLVPMATAVLISDASEPIRRPDNNRSGSNTMTASPLTLSLPIIEPNDNHEQSTITQMAVIVRGERSYSVEPEGAPTASRRTERTKRSSSANNSGGGSSGSSSPPLSAQEKRFWIKVIGVALCVNTLLVVGIVVGGVCATGGCTSSESPSPKELSSPSLAPTASPSRLLRPYDAPSSSPASFIHEIADVNGTMLPLNGTGPSENATDDDYPGGWNDTGLATGSPYPPPPLLFPPASAPPGGQESETSAAPFASPIVNGSTTAAPPPVPKHDSNHNRPTSAHKGVSAGALVAIAVAMEVAMVIGLIAYYRRWKSRRLVDLQRGHYADVDTSGQSD